MLRSTLLYLSNRPRIFRFVRNNRLAKRFAKRFVAGETLDEALAAVAALNARGIAASLDLLGESVTNEREARAAGAQYLGVLDHIHAKKLDANVSLKLTAMGLDISEELCISVMQDVLDRARELSTFVRLDMEGSAYTERTLNLFADRLYPAYKDHVGIVLQSYLYRTRSDVERAVQLGCRVRLCKGAYKEPASVAFPEKEEVDRNYVLCMRMLLDKGNYPGIATHDPRIIDDAKRYVDEHRIDRSRFEFQMLYGIRRDLQRQVLDQGFRLRLYVPYGTAWYPYFMRRLSERPANVLFVARGLFR
jgi:proline dehydrogenase